MHMARVIQGLKSSYAGRFKAKVGLYGGAGRALFHVESGSMPKRVGQYDQTARMVDAA